MSESKSNFKSNFLICICKKLVKNKVKKKKCGKGSIAVEKNKSYI